METTSIDFRILFESVPGLYLILSPELNIIGVNKAYAQATMTNAQDIIGRGLFEVFPDNPDDASANGVSNLLASLNFVRKNKRPHTMAVQKYDIRKQDGTYEVRYWSPLNIPVLNADEGIDYIIHRVEDVTEFVAMQNEQVKNERLTLGLQKKVGEMEVEIIKRAREIQRMNADLELMVAQRTAEVLQNERKFKALIENNHDIILLRDAQGKLFYQSPSTERILGWSFEDRQALPNFSLVHPEEREAMANCFKEALGHPGKVFQSIHRVKHKAGYYIWIEGTITNLLDDPCIGAVVLNFKDINAKVEAEEKTHQSEKRLINTLSNMLEGVQIISFDYQYIYVNEALAKQGKSTKEALVGRSMLECYPGIEHTEFFKTIQICMEQRIHTWVENEFVFQDGSKGYFELSLQPVPEGLFILSMDITDRKRTEIEMATQNRKLIAMNKELEQFAYVASHDLQEPLRTLISYTALIQKEFEGRLGQYGDKYLAFILQSSKRMQELVKGLLDYSRIGKEKELVSVDFQKTMVEVLEDMALSIDECGASITVSKLPTLNAYSVEVRQLFQNLLSNALKFRKKTANPKILVGASERENDWIFSFQDDGIGIEEINREKIFVIFKRLHNRNEYEGTGIGLAHCKKIIDFHGGQMWVESTPGTGSIFYFTIPKL